MFLFSYIKRNLSGYLEVSPVLDNEMAALAKLVKGQRSTKKKKKKPAKKSFYQNYSNFNNYRARGQYGYNSSFRNYNNVKYSSQNKAWDQDREVNKTYLTFLFEFYFKRLL
jgi:hypothetical protein